MWPEYIHHLCLHFPIVGSMGLTLVALMYVRNPADNLEIILRWAGWFVAMVTCTAVVSGIMAAPGFLGGDGPQELSHHRNMGIMVAVISLAAAIGFEMGVQNKVDYLKRYGAVTWFAVLLASIGAGHWGGSVVHSDRIPWDGTEPSIEEIQRGE